MKGRLNHAEATAVFDSESRWFLNAEERACFQLKVDWLCMPFLVFQQAVKICLNRRVGAGEYLRPRLLPDEINGSLPAPAIEDTLALVPP